MDRGLGIYTFPRLSAELFLAFMLSVVAISQPSMADEQSERVAESVDAVVFGEADL